eukprot:scaffold97154_cov32-Tisochrysis_lutea.AAC.3
MNDRSKRRPQQPQHLIICCTQYSWATRLSGCLRTWRRMSRTQAAMRTNPAAAPPIESATFHGCTTIVAFWLRLEKSLFRVDMYA